jgi:membrane protein YqaA with SNARE-associated domain
LPTPAGSRARRPSTERGALGRTIRRGVFRTRQRLPVERWASHPAGLVLLAAFAVLEATLFPAPTEALFVALVLGRKRRVGGLVALAALASVAGGALGYLMGSVLFEEVGRRVLAGFGSLSRFEQVGALYRENLFLALTTSGYTPIPYLVYTMAAGAFRVPLLPFLAYSLIGRGLKYLVLGALAYGVGAPVRALLGRYGPRAAVLLVIALLLGFWVLKW